jgi:hypothetical protein
MSEYVYASTIVLRHPEPGEFARVLTTAPCGTRYRDAPLTRATSRSRFQTPDEDLAPMVAPLVTTGEGKPRWTQERIDALPRTSGSLERVGDDVGRDKHGNPAIKCVCSGGSERCRKQMTVPASIWINAGRRPQSCQRCADKRKSRAYKPQIAYRPPSAEGYISAPRSSR